ncbi:pesticin C-terminus-like muramidase [Pseudomonas sp. Marseille-P9899]|uniref:pesticin C-terminus-like muramidase n=1 Tax=Pseudomonas sp. Marseille-P9899 TaxID=2730401 RepID=UPI00158D9B6A|nr:pesticin C-terminus-like muramidase [Pseudomonas sp. Marseille-P9899]
MRELTAKESFLICGGQSTNSTLTLGTLSIIDTQPFDPITLPEGTVPDEGGGGQSGPVENPYCITPARAVDSSFLSENEDGQRLNAYTPGGDSGVTVATGVDLFGRTQQSMASLGWPQSLINQLLPYTTQQGLIARDYLSANPLTISADNASLMDATVFEDIVNDIAGRFDAAASFADFDQLPPGTQTVIADIAYQYGPNLRVRTPNFWQQITTGDWNAALANLQDFNDPYTTRRLREAALLENDLNQFILPTPNNPC